VKETSPQGLNPLPFFSLHEAQNMPAWGSAISITFLKSETLIAESCGRGLSNHHLAWSSTAYGNRKKSLGIE
jgi:hypothetical protein